MPKIIGGTKEQQEEELVLPAREAEMSNPAPKKLKARSPILDVAQSALEAYAMGPGEYLKSEKQAGLAREEMAFRKEERGQERLAGEVELGRKIRATSEEGEKGRRAELLKAKEMAAVEKEPTSDAQLYHRYTKTPAAQRTKEQNDFIDAYLLKLRKGANEGGIQLKLPK